MTDYTRPAPPQREYLDAPPETMGGTRSIGEAFSEVTRDLSVLVQQELALAKAEVRQARPSACSPALLWRRSYSSSSCR